MNQSVFHGSCRQGFVAVAHFQTVISGVKQGQPYEQAFMTPVTHLFSVIYKGTITPLISHLVPGESSQLESG